MASDAKSAAAMAGISETDILQNQLLQRGFLHDYTMFDADQATYVVVTTLNGARSYIKIDSPVYNVIDANSRRTMLRTLQQLVPAAMTVGADQCLRSSICSVAFECKDGVCLRAAPSHSDGAHSQYVNYQVSRPVAGSIQVEEGSNMVRAYPVLPLSYVMNNPVDALKTVEQEYQRLNKEVTTITLSRSNDIRKHWSDISKIAADYDGLVTSSQAELSKIAADIEKTEKFQQHWAKVVADEPTNTAAADKLHATHVVLVRYHNAHRAIVDNLHHTNSIVDRVISDMSHLSDAIKDSHGTNTHLKNELTKDVTLTPGAPSPFLSGASINN